MDQAAAHLLDFSKAFDTTLFDQICTIAMDGLHPNAKAANDFLVLMKEHPDMWKRADAILETSTNLSSKFFALQVLSDAIGTRWKVLPADQREGIRNYIVGKIISLSSTDESSRQNNLFLGRLNLVLIQILKQDWPANWPTFISEIVGSSKTGDGGLSSLCENNMKILRLLSEEVFDFSKDTMTASKTKTMKESLNDEFSQVFTLCEFILETAQKQSLLVSTLLTLQQFLKWIPLGYIFETGLVPSLIDKFFPQPAFRTATLDCLIEIATLPPGDIPSTYWPTLQLLLVAFLQQLAVAIPRSVDLVEAYSRGTEEACIFVQRLALFLSTYLKSFLPLFDLPDGSGIAHEAAVLEALTYLIRVSQIKEEEVFKTCLEFWHHFAKELYTADAQWKTTTSGLPHTLLHGGFQSVLAVESGLGMSGMSQAKGNGSLTGLGVGAQKVRPKHAIYDEILHHLRVVMIDHMAKPEEVIIVEDDNGDIVREQAKDTEVIAQYKTMRDAIVYLTHLNYEDTEDIMLKRLESEVEHGKFPWNGLNTLCWAIGSISGAMAESDEKRFLVSVIKDLLKLCEEQRGKDNKAVVASNIMYIVGQYPRFLRAHWKFLKTVVNKLFEFMHELHPGVQDMACDTFLKIAQKCKRKFMTPQTEETEQKQPFICTLIADLQRHILDLQPHQVLSFYSSVGTMLSDHGPAIRLQREEVILRLMDLSNTAWKKIIADGSQNISFLLQTDTVREISKILKINISVCTSAGSIYVHQLAIIFMDLLLIYRLYSEQIVMAVAQQGPFAVRVVQFKAMRGVKAEIIELMNSFMEVCRDAEGGPQQTLSTFLPPLMTEVLNDYRTAPPAARDAKVLSVFSTAISVLREQISSEIPRIMDAIFEPTLEMITTNMSDNPEHRSGFFRFLREANEHCFYGLFSIAPNHQKLVVDSIVWAFKHTERNISETGLEILLELLKNIEPNPQIAQSFYQTFLVSLIQDVLGIMTDRLHKSGFKLQAAVLKHLFYLVQTGQVKVPLFDPSSMAGIEDNAHLLKEHVCSQIMDAFPNLSRTQAITFLGSLFQASIDLNPFKQVLRDFLVEIKEFASEDNSDLFIEETEANLELSRQEQWQYRASVPGLLKPEEIDIDPEL